MPPPDNLSNEQLSAETAKLKAQADYYTQAKALDAARKAYQAASAPPSAPAPTDDERKAAAEADKAEADALAARSKAIADSFPTSGITGKADSGDGAGKAQMLALSVLALAGMARTLVDTLLSVSGERSRWLLTTASRQPASDKLDAFELQLAAFEQAAAAWPAPTAPVMRTESVAGTLVGVGTALTLLDRAASWLRADRKLSGADLPAQEDWLQAELAAALRAERPHDLIWLPGLWPAKASDEERTPVVAQLRQPWELQQRLQAAAATAPPADLPRLQALITALDAWLQRLQTPDAQGVLPLQAIAQQALWRQRMSQAVVVLLLPQQWVGSLLVRNTAKSAFGWGTPYQVNATVAVGYLALDGADGSLLASGCLSETRQDRLG